MGKSRTHDALLSTTLFLVSLAINTIFLLTVPLRLGWDAARLGLYAHDLLQENLLPFYVHHQYAPHPFIIYVQALVIAVFGYSAAALRSVTVVGLALAAPAIYWASRWLFEDKGAVFARRAGLIAALGFALSTFSAAYSRHGIEPALLPVVELMAVAFLWRGFRRGRWTDFVLAGFLVGVSQYVYIVARFLPVALVVATIGAAIANRQLLAHWRGLIWAAASSSLVALPLWILYVVYPFSFTARVTNPIEPSGGQFIFELPDPVTVVAAKLANLLLAMSWHWDNWYNPQSFNSLLTPVLFAGLVVGVAVALFQRRDGLVFGILMMVMMLLPDLLTYEKREISAIDANRLFPGIPFIFIIAGLGTATIWAAIESRRRFPNWAGYIVPALVLVFGLLQQWDYLSHVRPQILAQHGLGTKYSQIARYVGDNLDRPILLPSDEYRHAPLAFLLAEHFPHRQGGGQEKLQQGENVTAILLNPDRSIEDGFPDEWVLLYDKTAYFLLPIPDSIEPLEGGEEEILVGNGDVVAKAIAARWQGEPPTYIPLEAHFANNINLVGYQSSVFELGSPLRVSLFWQPVQEIARDVEIFVQLYDLARQKATVQDLVWPLNGVFRVRAWHPGQIMPLSLHLQIPDELPPGPYQLNVAVNDLLTRNRIPLLSGGDSLPLTTFKVPLPVDHRVPEHRTELNFGNIIAFDGYTFSPTSDGLKITLFWRATDSPQFDYTSFVHIVDSDDRIVSQMDAQPLNGQYPTSIWSAGDVIVDEHILSPISQGEYRVYVGWYRHRGEGWERLPIVSEGTSSTDRALLGTISLP